MHFAYPLEPTMTSHFYLRSETVRDILSRQHCPMQIAAEELDLSPSYWSRLANGKKAVSTSVRWRILNSTIFAGVPANDLWEQR